MERGKRFDVRSLFNHGQDLLWHIPSLVQRLRRGSGGSWQRACRHEPLLPSSALRSTRGLHRGVVVTLLDTNCGLAIFSRLGDMRPIATIDLRVDFIRPVPAGRESTARWSVTRYEVISPMCADKVALIPIITCWQRYSVRLPSVLSGLHSIQP